MTMVEQLKLRMMIDHAEQFYQTAQDLGLSPKKFVSTLVKSEVRESKSLSQAMAQTILVAVIEHSIPETLTWEVFKRELEPSLRNFLIEILESKP